MCEHESAVANACALEDHLGSLQRSFVASVAQFVEQEKARAAELAASEASTCDLRAPMSCLTRWRRRVWIWQRPAKRRS
jgi:hypothetical protein